MYNWKASWLMYKREGRGEQYLCMIRLCSSVERFDSMGLNGENGLNGDIQKIDGRYWMYRVRARAVSKHNGS